MLTHATPYPTFSYFTKEENGVAREALACRVKTKNKESFVTELIGFGNVPFAKTFFFYFE